MEKISKTASQKCVSLSRWIFWLGSMGSLFLSGILMQVTLPYLEMQWGWLLGQVVSRLFLIFALLAFASSITIPGLLFIFLCPELGYAWMRGINFKINKPWEQLSDFEKFHFFLMAMVSLACGFLFFYTIFHIWFNVLFHISLTP